MSKFSFQTIKNFDDHIKQSIPNYDLLSEAIINMVGGGFGGRFERFILENGEPRDGIRIVGSGGNNHDFMFEDFKIIQNAGGTNIKIESMEDFEIVNGTLGAGESGTGIELVSSSRGTISGVKFHSDAGEVNTIAFDMDGSSNGNTFVSNSCDGNGQNDVVCYNVQTGATGNIFLGNVATVAARSAACIV